MEALAVPAVAGRSRRPAQLADLMAYPIARHAIDRLKPNPAFAIVRTKILDRPGWRHGLKIFP
jgi:hypothetical protein